RYPEHRPRLGALEKDPEAARGVQEARQGSQVMIRARTILLVGLPLVAVLVWASASTHASAGGDEPNGSWPPATPDVAARKQRPPRPPRDTWATPPAPPAPPVAGTPAAPPVPPTPPPGGRHRMGGRGVTVSIHDGKISIDGIDDMVH